MLASCRLSRSQVEEVKLFFSYSHQDKGWRETIADLLSRFNWDIGVRPWYDGDIGAGSSWAEAIEKNLGTADVILLFVTQRFVESDFCMQHELPLALARAARQEARVIPIILEPTQPAWKSLPFSHLQALPPGGEPLAGRIDRNQALADTVRAIVDVIAEPVGSMTSLRSRWTLKLGAVREAFRPEDEAAIVAALRAQCRDPGLRCRAVRSGSGWLKLEIDSDAHALDTWRNTVAAGVPAPRAIADWPVLEIVERYGADVRGEVRSSAPVPAAARVATDNGLLLESEPATAPFLKGITLNPKNLLDDFDFIVDTGTGARSTAELEATYGALARDFYVLLAAPEADHWVNLAPGPGARLLGKSLAGTRVGRCLLEHDLRLKRLAASLVHPDHQLGADYWRQVFERVQSATGSLDHVYSLAPRVWMRPGKAIIVEMDDRWVPSGEADPKAPPLLRLPVPPGRERAIVTRADIEMKCELPAAPLAGSAAGSAAVARICHETFVEHVLPVIHREINQGANFAEFRQLYFAMILAGWTKQRAADHGPLPDLVDSGNVGLYRPSVKAVQSLSAAPSNASHPGPPSAPDRSGDTDGARYGNDNEIYHARYMALYDNGVFLVRRHEYEPLTRSRVLRTYFCGAIEMSFDRLFTSGTASHRLR